MSDAEPGDPLGPRRSLEPIEGAERPIRQRLDLKNELLLAALPTGIVLAVLFFLEVLSNQRILFASLAASAFLIYLEPLHATNSIRTLVIAHLEATGFGLLGFWVFGHGYSAAAMAMVATIVGMILLDVVHPPAVSTSLSFAFRYGEEQTLILFVLALGITAMLVVIERSSLWFLARMQRAQRPG